MKQIWKYDVTEGSVRIPIGAKILSVQLQNNQPKMWVMVDPNEETEIRTFLIVGTGEDFDDTHFNYIGTYQINTFVWHLFEWIEPK